MRFLKSSRDYSSSSPLLETPTNDTEPSPSTSASRQPSAESLTDSLTSSIANSSPYSVITTLSAPAPQQQPLSTLIHPLRHLSTTLYARIYELPRRAGPRILKVC